MDFLQLQYTVTLADCRNYTKAAELLFISQPTLSQQIQKLEQEVGFPLFARTTRKVTLTPEGEIVVKEMRDILARMNHLSGMLSNINPNSSGVIRFGIMNFDRKAIPHALFTFVETYPNIQLQITEDWLPNLVAMLDNRLLDAALIAYPHEDENTRLSVFPTLTCTAVSSDYMVLAMSDRHPFAHRAQLLLEELSNERFLFASERSTIKDWVFELFSRMGIKPKPSLCLGSISSMIDFAIEGAGVSVISSTYAEKQKDRAGLVTVPIYPPMHRVTAFAVPRVSEESSAVKLLKEYMVSKI